jgi:putative peptidoglycan lipid II flippase
VVVAVSLSRLAGLVRERLFAQYLGTSAAADAFGAAFRIPLLLEGVLGDRMLSSASSRATAGCWRRVRAARRHGWRGQWHPSTCSS